MFETLPENGFDAAVALLDLDSSKWSPGVALAPKKTKQRAMGQKENLHKPQVLVYFGLCFLLPAIIGCFGSTVLFHGHISVNNRIVNNF